MHHSAPTCFLANFPLSSPFSQVLHPLFLLNKTQAIVASETRATLRPGKIVSFQQVGMAQCHIPYTPGWVSYFIILPYVGLAHVNQKLWTGPRLSLKMMSIEVFPHNPSLSLG